MAAPSASSFCRTEGCPLIGAAVILSDGKSWMEGGVVIRLASIYGDMAAYKAFQPQSNPSSSPPSSPSSPPLLVSIIPPSINRQNGRQ
jgi:hypothetical protein